MVTESPDSGGNARSAAPDVPEVGSAVSLLPATAAVHAVAGRLQAWDTSPHGLVVDARVSVAADRRHDVAQGTVWLSARTGRTGSLVVLRGRGEAVSGRPGEVVLSGMVTLATESRRTSVRAPVDREAFLVASGQRLPARVLDLSTGGCRLVVGAETEVPTGPVELQVTLSDDGPLRAAAHVLRVDPDTGQVTVHFDRLSAADARRVDSEVFATLGPQG